MDIRTIVFGFAIISSAKNSSLCFRFLSEIGKSVEVVPVRLFARTTVQAFVPV